MLRAGLVVCLGVAALAGHAQTQTGGAISVDTQWRAAQGPYVVTSDIVVQNAATLTIEAGTTVYMGADTRFTVQSGALKAIGTAQAPIRFTSQKLQDALPPAPGDWQQLTFGAGSTNASRLDHVTVEYGKGIAIAGASPTLNHLTAANNRGAAITLDLAASPSGFGNRASNNDINAIVVPAGEISGSVTWGLRGIPYLVASGTVSVGATPKVLSISPTSVQRGETQTVTVTGSRLSGLEKPTFDLAGLSAQVLAGTTDSQAQLAVTASETVTPGTATFSALTNAGEVSFADAMTVVDVQPKLIALAPSSIATGSGEVIVKLSGQNFAPQSVAHLDSAALPTTVVSATEIAATVPNQMTNAVKSINLHTPKPGGGEFVSNALNLTIVTPPPVVNSVAPNALRRGETIAMQIDGTGLGAVSLSPANSGLSIAGVTLSPTKVNFSLTAAANAALGTHKINVTNSTGSASASVTVNPALPTATVAPTPIAVPPDSSSRQFAIQLSYADTVSHTFTVTAADSSMVKVATTSLTIDAGKVQAVGSISGLKAGVTSLTLASPTLGTLSLPVYVTADFLGLNTSIAPLLGVVLTPPADVQEQSRAATAANVGVVFGNFVRDVTPKAFSIDSGTSMLTIAGSGLQDAIAVAVKPADGVTVGSVSVAPDGKTVSVPLTIAENAPVTQRQVILSSASGPYPVARSGADRILITLPHPEIYSIDPLFGTLGTSSQAILVRGRNLQGAQSLTIAPADGITFGTSPTVSSDGSTLNAVMDIDSSAALGPRVITVNAPSGSSDTAASAANTFTLVGTPGSAVTPIVAPVLGIVKLDDAAPPSQSLNLVAPALGVAFGQAATAISPQAKAVGDSFTLTVQGTGLQGVTGVSFSPTTGVTLGTPTIAGDGRSLTVPVSIAEDAPQTTRTVRLLAGSVPIVFTRPAASLFSVTAPQPKIDSTDPMAIQLGAAPVVMTLRGENFQNALSVRFVPPDGMTVSSPPAVDSAARQITVNVSAASGAAVGPRAVVVTTPGGETSSEMTVANTVSVGNTISTTGLLSPLLGIVKQAAAEPVSTTYGPLVANDLGIVFGEQAAPVQPASLMLSPPLGVTFGPVAGAVLPRSLARGSSGVLTVSGVGLDPVTGITIAPSDGITLGSPLQVSTDGRQVSVPVTVAADAAMTLRRVVVSTAAGPLVFAGADAATLRIVSDATLPVSSISPILATTGSLITLTVRGQNMQGASAVIAMPGTGLTFDSQPVVSSDGSELTVRIQIADDAPLGARVIQVITPTATSSDQASPANTFTVYAD